MKTNDPTKQFQLDREERIASFGSDKELGALSQQWLQHSMRKAYPYNFTWLGRPIIQYPQDIVAFQEIVHKVRPDIIIETGIAHGGSIVLSASMLTLLDVMEGLDPWQSRRKVIGVDIDIRPHNRALLDAHPLRRKMELIEGSSIAPDTVAEVRRHTKSGDTVLVCLDSNHTHAHVLAELEAYAPLVSVGSYCIVLDTFVEDMPEGFFAERPWDKGNSPKTAVWEYLRHLEQPGLSAADGASLFFEVDRSIEHKLLITVAPNGYLKRVASNAR